MSEKHYDVVALGELLIDFIGAGDSEFGNPLYEANPGGAPCNVLAMLQKLGKKTAFIGKVGNDGFLSAKKNSYFYMGSFHAGIHAFTTMVQVVVIVAGSYFIAMGDLEVTDLLTFLLYIGVFTEPIRTLIDFTEQFQNGYTGFCLQ